MIKTFFSFHGTTDGNTGDNSRGKVYILSVKLETRALKQSNNNKLS